MRRQPPSPPDDLSGPQKALWAELWQSWEFSPAETQTLLLGLYSLDRAAAARAVIEKEGEVITDRFGQLKENPAVAVENKALQAWISVQRELQLVDREDTRKNPRPDNRPPRPVGRYQRT